MTDLDQRVRTLEQQSAVSKQRMDAQETNVLSLWSEVGRIRESQADEYRALREQQSKDKDELRDLIIGNKLAGAMYSGGLKVIAWGIGTLITLGALTMTGISLLRKLFA